MHLLNAGTPTDLLLSGKSDLNIALFQVTNVEFEITEGLTTKHLVRKLACFKP